MFSRFIARRFSHSHSIDASPVGFFNEIVLINPRNDSNNSPKCKDCKFFEKYPSNVEEFAIKNGICNLFSQKDEVTGKKINFYSENCRSDYNYCGKDGFYFSQK